MAQAQLITNVEDAQQLNSGRAALHGGLEQPTHKRSGHLAE